MTLQQQQECHDRHVNQVSAGERCEPSKKGVAPCNAANPCPQFIIRFAGAETGEEVVDEGGVEVRSVGADADEEG